MNVVKRKCKVVMLPTNEKALNTILLNPSTNKIEISKGYLAKEYQDIGYKTLYLYIISDDKIKEGDWQIDSKNRISKFISTSMNLLGETYKKVIATTDSSLKIIKSATGYTETRSRTFYSEESLPQPSQSFIQKYIKEYNKGNIITDILVEYENNYDLNYYTPPGGIECCEKIDNWELKINPKDNTITIKKVKDSLKDIMKKDPDIREEVENLLFEALTSDGKGAFNMGWDDESANEWIKKNL